MMEEIKPCPFCGADNMIVVDTQASYWCKCFDCGSNGPPSMTKNGAIQLWNAAFNALQMLATEKLQAESDYKDVLEQTNRRCVQEHKSLSDALDEALQQRQEYYELWLYEKEMVAEARKFARYYYRKWKRVQDAFKE